jgi:hypothetical protein
MLNTMTAAVAPVLAEATSSEGVNPWFVGFGILLMFGAGRDHS